MYREYTVHDLGSSYLFGLLVERIGRKDTTVHRPLWAIMLSVVTLQCAQTARHQLASLMIPSFDSFLKVHLAFARVGPDRRIRSSGRWTRCSPTTPVATRVVPATSSSCSPPSLT